MSSNRAVPFVYMPLVVLVYRKGVSFFIELVQVMKVIFLKYYKDIPHVCLVSGVVDPRFKLERFKTLLFQYYKILVLKVRRSK